MLIAGFNWFVPVFASDYIMSMEAKPSVIDIGDSSLILVKLTRNGNPVPNIEVFLGTTLLKGDLENGIVRTDSNGIAKTKFRSSGLSEGFVLAKTNIYDGKNVTTIESAIPLTVKNLNKRPESFIDNVNPMPVRVGKPATFAGHCTDSDGMVSSWEWNFGDGANLKGEGFSSTVTHIYDKSGNFTVTFTATDNKGAVSDPPKVMVKVVDNTLPTIKSFNWPKRARVNESVSFVVTCEDKESKLNEIVMDFGDGTTEKRKIFGSEYTVKFDHIYQSTGMYNPTCVAIDDEGPGQIFPQEPWQLVIEGLAKGGLRLMIPGSTSSQIQLIGPLPSAEIAYENTITDDTVATGIVLEPGTYIAQSKDKSRCFKFPSQLVVPPGKVETYIGKLWKPWITANLESSAAGNKLNIRILDEQGPVECYGTIRISGKGMSIGTFCPILKGVCEAPLENLDSQNEIDLILQARFDEIEQTFIFKRQIPKPLPKFELSATRNIDSVTIYCSSQSANLPFPVMQVSAIVTDRLTGIPVDSAEVIMPYPSVVRGDKWPLMITLRPLTKSPGRHMVRLNVLISTDNLTYAESISFDPCPRQLKLASDHAYNETGVALISFGLHDIENGGYLPNQRFSLDYEIDDKYGFVDIGTLPKNLPRHITTDRNGIAVMEIDLKQALSDIPARSIRINAKTTCEGISYNDTLTVTTVTSPPKISVSSMQTGNTHRITVSLADSDSLPVCGGWIDVAYYLSGIEIRNKDLDALGTPPQSVRLSQNGSASFTIIAPNSKTLKLHLSAVVRGIRIYKEILIQ